MQIPPDWIERRHLTGRLRFGGSTEFSSDGKPRTAEPVVIECRLDEAEWLGERMAICRIDGGLSEQEADRVTLAQWQERERRFEERR